jgi:hypothetical protein
MKTLFVAFATLSLSSGLILAQNVTYKGLLVPAGCMASGVRQSNMQASVQQRSSTVPGEIVGDRTMKPADDPAAKPTRGSVDGMPYYTSEENPNYPAAKSSQPATRQNTGEADRMVSESRMSTDSVEEHNINNDWSNVASMRNDSCRLTPGTKSFALMLEDGRVIPLSRSSNMKVSQRLRIADVPELDKPIIVHGRVQRGVLNMQSMSL